MNGYELCDHWPRQDFGEISLLVAKFSGLAPGIYEEA
jgi:hypothetical protein